MTRFKWKAAAGDEPIMAHQTVFEQFGEPSLRDLLHAYAIYACTDCSVRVERMQDVEDRIQAMINAD